MNKNNNNKPQSKNQRKKNRKRELRQVLLKDSSDSLPNGRIVTVGKSSADYARCLANPITGPLAGIPVHPAQFSKKFRVWTKGTFTTQTSNGIGWVTFCPEYAIGNDYDSVYTSIAAGTSSTWFDITSGNATPARSNSEYSYQEVGSGPDDIAYRVVSAELKTRYIGTELNRSGQKVGILDQHHNSLYQRSLSSIDAEETAKRFPVDRTWTRVLYRPVDNDDFDFRESLPPYTPADTDNNFYMGIAIQAPSGVSLPFEYETYTCFEVFGKNIRAMTPSHVDPVGFGAVHAASQLGQNLYPTKVTGPDSERALVREAAGYVANNTTTFSHVSKSKKKDSEGLDAVLGTAGAGVATGLGLLGALSFLF